VKLKITVDDKTYEVDVEVFDETAPRGLHQYAVTPSQVRVPAAPSGVAAGAVPSGPVNEEKVCRSPITGTVVRLVAQPGQSIQPGDILIVLEAMKMENELRTSAPGVVAAIRVAAGQTVEKGQVLVELE